MDKKYRILILFALFFSIILFNHIIKNKSSKIVQVENEYYFPAKPKIWFCDKVLIPKNRDIYLNDTLLSLLINETNLSNYKEIKPKIIEFSCRKDVGVCKYDGKVCFDKAYDLGDFILQVHAHPCNEKYKPRNCTIKTCLLYFTGIGCPHCAKVDPLMFFNYTDNALVFEYEVYKEDNSAAFSWYLSNFIKGNKAKYMGIPQINFFNSSFILLGDENIIKNYYKMLRKAPRCFLPI